MRIVGDPWQGAKQLAYGNCILLERWIKIRRQLAYGMGPRSALGPSEVIYHCAIKCVVVGLKGIEELCSE